MNSLINVSSVMILVIVINCTEKPSFLIEKKEVKYLSDEMYVNAESGLRVRSEPDIDSKIITILTHGDRVKPIKYSENKSTIDGIEDYWISIILPNKKVGWVFGYYLTYSHPFIYNFFAYESQCEEGSTKLIMNENYTWKGQFYMGGFSDEHNCGANKASGIFYWDVKKKRVCFKINEYTKFSPVENDGAPACYIIKDGNLYSDKENNGFLINYNSEIFSN
ncbi:SH3 domain-containing protein [Leptospira jelokensis]|uniref:SH3 domain-containing protein n=1 Tax=Leptospira jelokensis TaxID=2484931 RepID=UPI001438450B|nr:SH3 domain-containing protein [Leptospira jelokensis]